MTIAVKLDPETEAALARLATERGQSLEELVGEAIRGYADYHAAFAAKPPGIVDFNDDAAYAAAIAEADAELDAGMGIPHEEVFAALERRLRQRG